eukprot:1413178-Pleurochrysis_carterae.AAC.1
MALEPGRRFSASRYDLGVRHRSVACAPTRRTRVCPGACALALGARALARAPARALGRVAPRLTGVTPAAPSRHTWLP